MSQLISANEVGELLGVSARRVNALAAQRADFPRPAFERPHGAGTTRLWNRGDVERWIATANRAPGRRPNDSD